MQLGELQENLPKFRALGAEVWAVSSTDAAEKLAGYSAAKGLTFPLLSDAGLLLTRRYGVLNDSTGGMAYPATLVIDRKGVVRFVQVDVDFRVRPPAKEILDALRNLKD